MQRAAQGPRRECRDALPPHQGAGDGRAAGDRSEEHTSELQSRLQLVCRLLLEKKKQTDHHAGSSSPSSSPSYLITSPKRGSERLTETCLSSLPLPTPSVAFTSGAIPAGRATAN